MEKYGKQDLKMEEIKEKVEELEQKVKYLETVNRWPLLNMKKSKKNSIL
ncbi:MAG: hypothetical protein J7K51_05805 [Thermotogae bacterium]|nr:hypothetical protein [Thermotogota bacterium]